jgi:hypothetical protein
MLSHFGYSDYKHSPTPYDPSMLLRKNHTTTRDQLKYSQIISSPMYFASAMRLDISFAISKLSRFVSNPEDDNCHSLERVLHYLKGTMSYGIYSIWYPRVLEVIVKQIVYLMLMKFTPQVAMHSHLEATLCHGSLTSRPS